MTYREYISERDGRWDAKKQMVYALYGRHCALNATHTDFLNVHHNTYVRLFNELPEDLVILCSKCHQHFHDILPKPPEEDSEWQQLASGTLGIGKPKEMPQGDSELL